MAPDRRRLVIAVCAIAAYSEKTARRIDDEIRTLLETAHGRVRETLAAKREVLTSLARLLSRRTSWAATSAPRCVKSANV